MKRIITVFILSLFLFPVFGRDAAKEITISRVRVFLNDVEITGEEESVISCSTILSFTTIKAGKKFTEKALALECEQTRLRLMNSGFFYNAVVEIVPPRKNPDARTVIISVTKGFLPRFGGGPIYAMLGKVAIDGKRNQLLGFAGWNLFGASYTDEHFCNLPLIAGASLSTNAPSSLFASNGVNFNGSLTLGTFINPDLRFCIDVFALENTKTGFDKNKFILSPYFYWQHFINSSAFAESEARLYYKPALSSADFATEISASINWWPCYRINVAALACGGTSFGKNQENQSFLYDLSLEHTSVSARSGLSKRAIRSGYAAEALSFDTYLMASLETRFRALDFIIAGTFPCGLRPFIYTDLALGKTQAPSEAPAWNFVDAYGAGLQINFDCPVFAYFNFAYGFNHEGKGRFCFYTGLSF